MPSPVGHALGGVLVGLLATRLAGLAPRAPNRRAGRSAPGTAASPIGRRALLWLAALGMAADLDLLVGRHNAQSHSVGAALLVGAAAVAVLLWRAPAGGRLSAPRIAVVAAAAYGSHVLLDWLNTDTAPPVGIMALWPFDHGYYQSPRPLFLAISRDYERPGFLSHNLAAIAREVALLAPLCVIVWWWVSRSDGAAAKETNKEMTETKARRGASRGSRGHDARQGLRVE